jgi:hypothetical protein
MPSGYRSDYTQRQVTLLQAHYTGDGFNRAFYFAIYSRDAGMPKGITNVHRLFDMIIVSPANFAPNSLDRRHVVR